MGKSSSGRKSYKQSTEYNKGPKAKPSFDKSSSGAPSLASLPRDIPRAGRHIHVGGHPRFKGYKGG